MTTTQPSIWMFFTFLTITSNTVCSRNILVEHLLLIHNADCPPNNFINVSVDGKLNQILNIDEKQQQFSALIWMSYKWADNSLIWNSSISNETEIWLPDNKVWKPDIHMLNLFDYNDVNSQFSPLVIVSSSGVVRWNFPAVYTVFPFDEQVCEMQFASWQIPEKYLDLHQTRSSVDLTWYTVDDLWHLESAMVRITHTIITPIGRHAVQIHRLVNRYGEDTHPEIRFRFLLKRRPLFYIFTLVIPLLMITSIALVGLFSPTSSEDIREEKVTLGITTMLTMAVFLLMISHHMPRNSTTLPLLSRFILFQLVLISTAIIATVIILNVERGSYRFIANWLIFTARYRDLKIGRIQRRRRENESLPINLIIKRKSISNKQWMMIARRLDNWALMLYFTILTSSTLIFLIYGYNKN